MFLNNIELPQDRGLATTCMKTIVESNTGQAAAALLTVWTVGSGQSESRGYYISGTLTYGVLSLLFASFCKPYRE